MTICNWPHLTPTTVLFKEAENITKQSNTNQSTQKNKQKVNCNLHGLVMRSAIFTSKLKWFEPDVFAKIVLTF